MGFHLGYNIRLMVTLWQTNTAGWKMDPLEIYFLLNMGIFQPAHVSLPFVPQLVFSDVFLTKLVTPFVSCWHTARDLGQLLMLTMAQSFGV